MMNRLLLFLFSFLGCCSLHAQINLNKGGVFHHTFCDTIPFEFIQGKMVVKLEIGNKPRKFILDTGAPFIVFEKLQPEIDIRLMDKVVTLKDAVGGFGNFDLAKVKSFKLGRVEFRNVSALLLSQDVDSFIKCWDIDGIIGSNAFRNCILQIDLKAKRLILTNKLNKLDLSDSSVVPLHLNEENSQPYLELSISKDQVVLANFDTGDEMTFTISKEDSAIPLERQAARLIDIGHGKMMVSLTDSQQDQWYRHLTFDTLSIGATRFLDFRSTAYAEQNYSFVGMGLGAYGIMTIDYLHKQFYFQHYGKKQLIEAEKPILHHGFNIFPKENHYVIGLVWKDSPAGRLGLQSGHKVWRVEGVDFTKRTPELDCALLMGEYFRDVIINLEYLDDEGKLKSVSLGKE